MKKWVPWISLLFILLFCGAANGLEIKGVTLADTLSVSGKSIQLVGAGIRTKTFLRVKVYVAGLYMENPSKDVRDIIKSDQVKRMTMHFLYKEVSREKLVDGWNEGFKKNSKDSLPTLQNRIDRFNTYFEGGIKKGEEIILTYIPEKGTQVTVKGEERGTIEGKDFMEGLFKIWFGEHPADKGLKKSILK